MRRLLCLVLLGAAVALPLPAATACSPALPSPDVDRERVAPGETLRVSGDWVSGPFECDMVPPPPPTSAAATGGPVVTSPSPDPGSGGPLPTGLPTPFFPADALRVAKPSDTVRVSLRPYTEWPAKSRPARTIARVTPQPPVRIDAEHARHRFSALARIPIDVVPGRYLVEAEQPGVVWFGDTLITVTPRLPDTGRETGSLVRLGLLAVVTGAVAVAAARRSERSRT